MEPEVVEGIRIAEKHLAGKSVARRKALALDIAHAITNHAGTIAAALVEDGVARANIIIKTAKH